MFIFLPTKEIMWKITFSVQTEMVINMWKWCLMCMCNCKQYWVTLLYFFMSLSMRYRGMHVSVGMCICIYVCIYICPFVQFRYYLNIFHIYSTQICLSLDIHFRWRVNVKRMDKWSVCGRRELCPSVCATLP